MNEMAHFILDAPFKSWQSNVQYVMQCARQQRQRWRPLRACVRSGEGRRLLQEGQRRRQQLLQTATGRQATAGGSRAPLVALDGVSRMRTRSYTTVRERQNK